MLEFFCLRLVSQITTLGQPLASRLAARRLIIQMAIAAARKKKAAEGGIRNPHRSQPGTVELR